MSSVAPGLLGTWDFGSHVCRTYRDVPSCPRTSWDIWTWDSGSQVWYDNLGYSGISRVVQGLVGIFGPGTL